MAFRLRHWITVALVGCALVAIAYLPSAGRQMPDYSARFVMQPRPADSRRSVVLQELLNRAEGELRWLNVRDSLVMVATDSTASSSPPSLFFEATISLGDRDGLSDIVHRAIEPIRSQPQARFTLITIKPRTALDDGATRGQWYNTSRTYYAPQATDGSRCIARLHLVKQDPGMPGTWFDTLQAPRLVLGPCAFYAAFGRPGAGIEAWLEEAEYSPALYPAWLAGRKPPTEKRFRDWLVWRERDLIACAAGNRSRCVAGLRKPPRGLTWYWVWGRRPADLPGVIAVPMLWDHAMGEQVRYYLSDLLVAMGDDKFARFWSSDKDLETAFLEAFGVPMEQWTMDWARVRIGRPPAGPFIQASSIVVSLLVAVGAAVGSIFLVNQRQTA